MRPETKKLIEEKQLLGRDVAKLWDCVLVSDLQEIIDSETKPLHDAIAFHLKTIRDEFAMRAPEAIPRWFMELYDGTEFYSEFQIIDHDFAMAMTPKAYFKWRFYYADQMMKEREL